jgi:type IV pilus assembly protein PilP
MTRLLVVLAIAAAACGNRTDNPPPPQPPGPPPAQEDAGDPAAEEQPSDRLLNYPDEQFVEAETSRDPFRRYAGAFEPRPANLERLPPVPMGNVSVDDVRLIAIISGVANPAAMLVDPSGVGYVVRRGEAICRPEIVQTGGAESVAVPLHWRVERIRDDSVVLSREDRTAPNRPPITRIIQLHEEARPRP